MKTSIQWWNEVKQDQALFLSWLQRQYRGEVSAAHRLREVIDHFSNELTQEDRRTLYTIMQQEAMHATWVKDLLLARGQQPDPDQENATRRYWATQDLSFKDFAKTMAVAAHAEKMRLERIEAIAMDEDAPTDVRSVFSGILIDETFHEEAFRKMAGPQAMSNTKADHEEGRKLLGLEA